MVKPVKILSGRLYTFKTLDYNNLGWRNKTCNIFVCTEPYVFHRHFVSKAEPVTSLGCVRWAKDGCWLYCLQAPCVKLRSLIRLDTTYLIRCGSGVLRIHRSLAQLPYHLLSLITLTVYFKIGVSWNVILVAFPNSQNKGSKTIQQESN